MMTGTTTISSSAQIENRARHNILGQIVVNDIDKLFLDLDVDVSISGNKYIGRCPIHNGDRPNALNLYYEGHSLPGYWECKSRNCHKTFYSTIIGFTRGRLSNLRLGYHPVEKPEAMFGFQNTVKYLCDLYRVDFKNIKIDKETLEKQQFIKECEEEKACENQFGETKKVISRDQVRNTLLLPAYYYVGRGYSADILDKYDIGVSKKPKLESQNRVIVPIYNRDNYLVGYSARSIFEKCSECSGYHKVGKVCPESTYLYSKWRHVGFESSRTLYNYWNAYSELVKTNVAVLVEGPGDIWRLEENGIHNGLAMFGTNLSPHQERLLAKAQVMSIIVLTDSDEAGLTAAERIKNEYGRLYRLYFPKFQGHDIGEMNSAQITKEISPIIDKVMNVKGNCV